MDRNSILKEIDKILEDKTIRDHSKEILEYFEDDVIPSLETEAYDRGFDIGLEEGREDA